MKTLVEAIPNIIGKEGKIFKKNVVYLNDEITIHYLAETSEELFSFNVNSNDDIMNILITLSSNGFHIYSSEFENLNYDELIGELQ